MLVFRPYEKNLFGEARSWAAQGAGGLYVITRAPNGEKYQASYQAAGMRPELLQGGEWRASYELMKKACEEDASRRTRQRVADKIRRPR